MKHITFVMFLEHAFAVPASTVFATFAVEYTVVIPNCVTGVTVVANGISPIAWIYYIYVVLRNLVLFM